MAKPPTGAKRQVPTVPRERRSTVPAPGRPWPVDVNQGCRIKVGESLPQGAPSDLGKDAAPGVADLIERGESPATVCPGRGVHSSARRVAVVKAYATAACRRSPARKKKRETRNRHA